ncbi:FadR/GntR family transcriptional regulator [Corallococcus carmarthensis]|uniref:FadR/GntR family transcriptional regulator n=1 Tax=Corallococcus carmarthensis TaxID=2316728 RepID=UPI003134347F
MAYVEAELERDIALGRLPPCGQFGSEAKLARSFDVCRGTIREAMRRLAARGLVVQRPGRKTRAVALDESLTLENLGLVLHDANSAEARSLLEGYFSLKRQVLVELLADCCVRASDLDLHRLADTCFKLWDAARWESGARCAQVEFELLRLAAWAASRPGHALLIQSLQRASRGVAAAGLFPFMGGESLRQWASCAMSVLTERDARTLQHELPALLKACDERVLDAFAPAPQRPASPEAAYVPEGPLSAPVSATAQEAALETLPCVEEGGPDAPASAPGQDEALKARLCVEEHGFDCLTSAGEQDAATEARPGEEEHGLAPGAEDHAALGVAPRPQAAALLGAPDSGKTPAPAAPRLALLEPLGKCIGTDVPGATLGNPSDCRTRWDASSPEGGLPSEPSSSRVHEHTGVAECEAGGPFHGRLDRLGRWVARLWRSIAHSLGRPASCSRASGDLLRAVRRPVPPTRPPPSPRPDAASRAHADPASG